MWQNSTNSPDKIGIIIDPFVPARYYTFHPLISHCHRMTRLGVRSVFRFLLLSVAFIPLAAFAQTNDDCLMCHSDKSASMAKKGKTVSLFVDGSAFKASAHGDLECVSCHAGFDPSNLPHAKKITPVDCNSCHSDGKVAHFAESVHGKPKRSGGAGIACSDCHSTHAILKLSEKSQNNRGRFALETCARCHADVNDRFMQSAHGRALSATVKGAPSCIDCHGEHDVSRSADDSSHTNRHREAAMCEKCHLDNPDVRAKVGPSAGFVESYEKSVHARAMKGGNALAATCSDCHGSHDMRKGIDRTSRVNKANIAATCGRCHGDIQKQYEGSSHGKALTRGIEASATCTDCHGEHRILAPSDAASPVAPANVSSQVCSPCHSSVKLTSKYGLASDRFTSFADSYHGLASKSGSVEVANCASCHGVHDIKPSSDPSSRIHKSNLVATCGTCHPGANENFTKGSVHVIAISGGDDLLSFVASTYVVIIVVTIGMMFFHNVIDFYRRSKNHLMIRRGLIPGPRHGKRLYLRMSLNERIQHATLVISFVSLVITGFALRFPDAWWVVHLRNISPLMFDLRGIIHRVAAVVMVTASLYHVYYVLVVPRGKQLLRDILPVRQDLTDAIGVLKYNLGFSKTKPAFARFSYAEKAEYWALIWGTIVMTLTGIILWFENTFLGILTKTGWDVSRTVHYYEAWLATLSILVWHFYFVIFNPDAYPVNLAFLKGTITEEEMEEEHPLELEEVKKREAAQQKFEEEQSGKQ
jgi:formate dehydrogenase gamma subunit